MKLEGSLQDNQLVELLHQLAALRKTGILTVQSQTDIIAVTFLDGRIVAADALNEPMEEGLGQVIVSQGLVSADQFSMVASQAKAENERVANLLVQRGLVGRPQVLQALRLQTYRLLLQLLVWREGDYNVFVGDEISYEEGFDALSVEELLIRSIGDLSADSPIPGPIPDASDRFARGATSATVRVLGIEGDEPSGEPGVVWLSSSEAGLYEHLQVERSGAELMNLTGLDEYSVRYCLYRLMSAGMIEPRASEQVAPSPTPVAAPVDAPAPVLSAAGAPDSGGSLLGGGAAPALGGPALGADPAAAGLGTPSLEAEGLSLDSPPEEERSDLSSLLDPMPEPPPSGGGLFSDGSLSDLDGLDGGTGVLESGLSDTSSLLRNTDQLSALLEDAPVRDGTDAFMRDTGSFRGIATPEVGLGNTEVTDSYLSDLTKTSRTRNLELIGTSLDVWLGRVMALGLFLTLGLALSLPSIRNGLFFPFPWQAPQRSAFEVSQNSTLAAKIDRAVRTYFLLYGRFPEQLGVLADLELLRPTDSTDGRGRQLEYTSAGRHYTLQPLEGGEPVPGMERTAEVSQDFLLDPDYVRLEHRVRRPLVLLD